MKIIAIGACANWFKLFKNDNFDINDKERPAAVKAAERGWIAER